MRLSGPVSAFTNLHSYSVLAGNLRVTLKAWDVHVTENPRFTVTLGTVGVTVLCMCGDWSAALCPQELSTWGQSRGWLRAVLPGQPHRALPRKASGQVVHSAVATLRLLIVEQRPCVLVLYRALQLLAAPQKAKADLLLDCSPRPQDRSRSRRAGAASSGPSLAADVGALCSGEGGLGCYG